MIPSFRSHRLAATLAAALAALVWLGCADEAGDSLVAPPTTPQAGVVSGQDLAAAIAAQERHTGRLLAMPGVVGTAVGLDDAGHAVVKVYLASPGAAAIPARLDDVPVSTHVSGLFWARSDPTTKARPAPMGFSVGHPDITAGTFGAKVTNGTSVFILSNNHVLANSNSASIGDAALQPGPFDGGTSEDQIGTLADFEPILFDGSNNLMDAAIALVNDADVLGTTPTDDGYGAPSSTLYNGGSNWPGVLLGLGVQKYGRTTELTAGTVDAVNATVTVCYAGFIFCTQSARFVDQIIITPGGFSDGGDSGSLIVTNDANKNPVGLLFAGSSSQTIANRIDHVLNAFGVTVVGEEGTGDPDPDPEDDPPSVAITSPTNGAIVSGTITISAEASDDVGVESVEFLVDGALIGTDTDAAGGWSISWNTENQTNGSHDLTARATDTANQQTTSATVTVTVENDGGTGGDGTTMHVHDLAGTSVNNGSNWTAIVTVTVHDDQGNPVPGVTVSGHWNGGGANSASCGATTDSNGQCTVQLGGTHKRVSSVTFTVDDLTNGLTYVPGDNNETSITVSKP